MHMRHTLSYMTSVQAGHYVPGFDLADRIRKAREAQEWDIATMAKALGVNRNSVSNWENRKYAPHHKNLEDISTVTGVSLAWLVAGDAEWGGIATFVRQSEGVRPASPPEQSSLHRARHDATVEAAIRYSLEHGGERVELSDAVGLTIVENGEVVATIRRQPDRGDFYSCRNTRSDFGLAA